MRKVWLVWIVLLFLTLPAFCQWQGRLSADDQRRFDSYYSRWLESRRANDRDGIINMERRMQDLMAQYNIPPDTPFSQIASPRAGDSVRPNIPRFSSEDEKRFRSYYSRWQEYKRTDNRDEIMSMEKRMQDVMEHYKIPLTVSYDDVMWSLDNGGRYSNIPHFSAEDEKRFRSYYSRWQEYKRTNNRDEIISMEKRMQDVMEHYKIPLTVSYDDVMDSLNGTPSRWR